MDAGTEKGRSFVKLRCQTGIIIYLIAEKRAEYEKDREMVTESGLEDHYTCTDIDTMEEIARQVPLSRNRTSRSGIRMCWRNWVRKHITVDAEVWKQVMVRGRKSELSFYTDVWY